MFHHNVMEYPSGRPSVTDRVSHGTNCAKVVTLLLVKFIFFWHVKCTSAKIYLNFVELGLFLRTQFFI